MSTIAHLRELMEKREAALGQAKAYVLRASSDALSVGRFEALDDSLIVAAINALPRLLAIADGAQAVVERWDSPEMIGDSGTGMALVMDALRVALAGMKTMTVPHLPAAMIAQLHTTGLTPSAVAEQLEIPHNKAVRLLVAAGGVRGAGSLYRVPSYERNEAAAKRFAKPAMATGCLLYLDFAMKQRRQPARNGQSYGD